jgi:CHAT domain-containing protein
LRASEIQQMLDDETLLLEYWLGEEQGYVWAVTRTSIASFNLRPRAQIDAAAREAYNLLITPPSRRPTTASEVDAAIDALSRMILDDPLAGISRRTRLLVVADGALHYIPFTALTVPTSGSDTIARVSVIGIHEIVSLPSASIIAGLRRDLSNRPLAPRTVAVVADPVFDAHDSRVRRHNPRATPASGASSAGSSAWAGALARSATDVGTRGSGDGLPRLVFSRREAQAIVGLVSPGEGLQALDFAASRATVTGGALRDYRVVHIATHGFLNPVHPELSGVVLSLVDQRGVPQDGFLQLHDIYNLRLVAELVVLSACQTGVGAEIWGEGLVGLTRGVMYAGARASSSASGELTMKRRRS